MHVCLQGVNSLENFEIKQQQQQQTILLRSQKQAHNRFELIYSVLLDGLLNPNFIFS